MLVSLAWRLFRHELSQGQLTIIFAAIALSVTSVFSLGLFSERLQQSLEDKSAAFLAADRVLTSSKPLASEWLQQAQQDGLDSVVRLQLTSMVFADDEMMLADVRGVSEGYPLRGDVTVTEQAFTQGTVTDAIPSVSEAWVDSRLFQGLGLSVGGIIEIGDRTFIVSKLIDQLPDAGFSVFSSQPKVLLNYDGLLNAGLVSAGSRQSFALMLRGDELDLGAFEQWLLPRLNTQQHRWRSVADDDTDIGRTLARAKRFFLLASVLAIILAALAIGVSAQRYAQRNYDPVAIFKTLGASSATIKKLYVLQLSYLMTVAIITGLVLGYGLQWGVSQLLASQFDVVLSGWHWQPLIAAVMTGLLCVFGFSFYPLLQLFAIPPLRVLNRSLDSHINRRVLHYLLACVGVFLMLWLFSGDLLMSGILLVAGGLLVSLLTVASMALIKVGRWFSKQKVSGWHLAWARISRRALENSVPLIGFSLTMMLLLLVIALRTDLVKQWQAQLPDGTANYFMINIASHQVQPLSDSFAEADVSINQQYPMLRARVVKINGQNLHDSLSKDEQKLADSPRARLGREANLTWKSSLQEGNTVVEGAWFDAQPDMLSQLSIEQKFAERQGIMLGDEITFNIASEQRTFTVTSIREVNWQTLRPNFFFVLRPEAMLDYPASYISSFYLPSERKSELAGLFANYNNVTLYDVDARINQISTMISQVSMAVEFILILVLLAGSLVLVAQTQASMSERRQELAILRTLGAEGRLLRRSVGWEFVIIGLIAGLIGVMVCELSLWALTTFVFDMQSQWHWQYWLLAPVIGSSLVAVIGVFACRRVLRLTTSDLLRCLG